MRSSNVSIKEESKNQCGGDVYQTLNPQIYYYIILIILKYGVFGYRISRDSYSIFAVLVVRRSSADL